MFRDKLGRSGNCSRCPRFEAEAASLRGVFLREVELAKQDLSVFAPWSRADPALLSTLETIQSGLPAQIDVLNDLAATGDGQ